MFIGSMYGKSVVWEAHYGSHHVEEQIRMIVTFFLQAINLLIDTTIHVATHLCSDLVYTLFASQLEPMNLGVRSRSNNHNVDCLAYWQTRARFRMHISYHS